MSVANKLLCTSNTHAQNCSIQNEIKVTVILISRISVLPVKYIFVNNHGNWCIILLKLAVSISVIITIDNEQVVLKKYTNAQIKCVLLK